MTFSKFPFLLGQRLDSFRVGGIKNSSLGCNLSLEDEFLSPNGSYQSPEAPPPAESPPPPDQLSLPESLEDQESPPDDHPP